MHTRKENVPKNTESKNSFRFWSPYPVGVDRAGTRTAQVEGDDELEEEEDEEVEGNDDVGEEEEGDGEAEVAGKDMISILGSCSFLGL